MSTAIDAMKDRSSTRGYTQQPLTEQELQAVIQAGLQAPTATNRQEIHFTVLPGSAPILKEIEDEKNRMRDLHDLPHNFYYEAPTLIIVSGEKAFGWSELDAGIAVENMALAAQELGLGSLIIGCIRDAMNGEKKDYFEKAVQIPEGYEFKIALAVGHKAAVKEPHTYDADKQVSYCN